MKFCDYCGTVLGAIAVAALAPFYPTDARLILTKGHDALIERDVRRAMRRRLPTSARGSLPTPPAQQRGEGE